MIYFNPMISSKSSAANTAGGKPVADKSGWTAPIADSNDRSNTRRPHSQPWCRKPLPAPKAGKRATTGRPPSADRLLRLQQRTALHVPRLREHVHRLHFPDPVPQLGQIFRIAGEGGGIAGHIDDSSGLHGGRGLQKRGIASLPRRIEHDDVRSDPLAVPAGHHL